MPYTGRRCSALHYFPAKNQNKNGELLGIYANIFRTEQPLQFLPPRPPVSSFGSLPDAARTPNQSMQRLEATFISGYVAPSSSSSLLAPSSCHCHVSGAAWVYVHGWPSCSRIPTSSGSGCHIQHELVPTAMCVDLLLLFSLVCFMASIGKASS